MTYVCNECNGSGVIEVKKSTLRDFSGKELYITYPEICSNCKGFGKINWVENIFGSTRKMLHNEWEDRYYDI